jgi:diaminohydroxyphosphoribosylaminopyrimidine deaminase/5-amino-6-(5-phosphoribosylamino)uracil reductase
MACRLAQKAAGRTSPNPMVGAVLVRGGKIIATGFHHFAGGDHAEIDALKRAGARAKGASLYINLEPCSYQGRTPPCTRALIGAGVKEVVAGMQDPNPLVRGRGFSQLKRAGVRVRVGLLEERCRQLNEAFVKYITRKLPFVALKMAASFDGKIAAANGDARWITGVESRLAVHHLRDQVDAVLVGAGTVVMDDPQLTCRIPGGRDPWRIVVDGRLRVPLSAKLLRHGNPGKTLIATSDRAPQKKIRALQSLGVHVRIFPLRNGVIPWPRLLKSFARMGIVNVMIEGGATTAASALKAKMVDKIYFFYAPKIIGGDGRVMIDGLGIKRVSQSIKLEQVDYRCSGMDLLVTGYL